MKKEYITPEMLALEMQVSPICTISGGGTVSVDDDPANAIDPGIALGREDDFGFEFEDDFDFDE